MRDCQVQAVKYGLKNPYSIIAMDPGLGKSRVAIEIQRRWDERCIVVCPSYLVANWVDQLRQWHKNATYEAIKRGKDIPRKLTKDFTLMSYDLSQKAEHLFDNLKLLVLDESHSIKSQKAKRTQFIHRVVYENSVKSVIQLTGTPIKNRVEEFYSLMALCNYNPSIPNAKFLQIYPDSITFADHFSNRHEYTIPIGNRFVRIVKWTGIRNLGELKKWLHGHFYRVRSDEVLDVPILFKDFIVSDQADEALAADFEKFFENEDARGVNPTAKAEAALRKAPITAKYALDLLEEVDCVVVYTDHVAACEAIAKALGVEALHGMVPAHKRMEIAQKFQAGEGRAMVATIQSMSTGITLTRANQLIISDPCWSPGDLKQTYLRINRLGQEKICTVHRMIGSPQDKYIMDTLQAKIEVIEKVV